MKKFIYILIILFITTSCIHNNNTDNIERALIKKQGGLRHNMNVLVLKFEYNGHSYLCFKSVSMESVSMVHDPDCPCHKK